jgi:hypothetical protein
MEIDLALLADAATIDGSGKLNILGVFDRVSAAAFPAQHGRMALVLRFSAGLPEAGPHKVGIRLTDPEGVQVLRLDGEMQLAPGPLSAGGGVKVPHVLNLDGIVLTRSGHYTFDVSVDDQHHVSIPLNVIDAGGGALA